MGQAAARSSSLRDARARASRSREAMYEALSLPPCIDIDVSEPRLLTLHERAKANCERAEALANLDAQLNGVRPPWCFFAERHSILEAECERRCVQLASQDDIFLAPHALLEPLTLSHFEESLPSILPVLSAALRESSELAQLMKRLVPARVDATTFWFCLSHHGAHNN